MPDSDETTGVPWRSPRLYLLVAMAAVAPLDVNIIGPALPAIADAFDVSSARSGLVITAFAAPGAFLAPIVGMYADRFGRRRIVVPCLLIYGVAGVAVTLVTELWMVLVLRAVQGSVGGSILASLSLALVGDYYDGPRRNAVMGVVSASISFSAAAGPVLGGVLAARSWDAPFYLYGSSVVVAGLVYYYLDAPAVEAEGTSSDGRDGSYIRAAIASLPTRQALVVYGATLAGFTLFFGGVLTAVPFLLEETYGLESGRVGALVTGAMMVAAVVAVFNGRFARYLSNLGMVTIGFGFYALGLVGVWAAGSATGVLLALGVFGIGHGLLLPSVASALSALAGPEFRGGVMSLRTSVILGAQAIGPPLFTLPATRLDVGYELPLAVAGVGAALFAVGLFAAAGGRTGLVVGAAES
ncbi:MFS transporter [Haloplanus aerogenes]|uniref:MFS transporter n=1 Tax=Haloplanus aerogenes TaxID=660522 RepID=A0A3M0DA78_9EURY|nr:MFS transporter [Haloplanus aerogenes]AZH26336.1 MFS transporter [Haloplanus aerogenes]RMB18205.1 putative MFS family arabinose efflux permease [Haloplanus aerogenes]